MEETGDEGNRGQWGKVDRTPGVLGEGTRVHEMGPKLLPPTLLCYLKLIG